jgi:hypothetical protein
MSAPIIRAFAGLDVDPWGPIDNIKALLADVYKYDPKGRTILRELVQNADDAKATRLHLHLSPALAGAVNPLLQGPALVVLNDGPFPERDREGMHRAMGGAKRDDVAKVGRFGLGMKSVFHVCEAFVYLGRSAGEPGCAGVLNPWTGTDRDAPAQDPRYPEWNTLTGHDLDALAALSERLLPGSAQQGLLLWLPLRDPDAHCRRGADRTFYGIGDRTFRPADLERWFSDPEPLALLLAQTAQLGEIAATANDGERGEFVRVRREGGAAAWMGRPQEAPPATGGTPRAYGGPIASARAGVEGAAWAVKGQVLQDDGPVHELQNRKADTGQGGWPSDRIVDGGTVSERPRKAAGHVAAALVHPVGGASERPEAPEVRVRWCVFFPLDDSPDLRQSTALVHLQPPERPGGLVLEVLLHGYFWPSQDRRSLPGLAGEDRTGDIREDLNQTLARRLLLPLLPGALEFAMEGLPRVWASSTVRAVDGATKGLQSEAAHGAAPQGGAFPRPLVPRLEGRSQRWRVPVDGIRLIGLAQEEPAATRALADFAIALARRAPETWLVAARSPRLGGALLPWTPEEVGLLLDQLRPTELGAEGPAWLVEVLRGATGADEALAAPFADVVGAWFGGALAELLTGGPPADWSPLLALLPPAWLCWTVKSAATAIAELSRAGLLGAGLLAWPGGRAPRVSEAAGLPEPKRLVAALHHLGGLLAPDQPAAQARPRLLLAEALLRALPDPADRQGLRRLKLLRAHRLPSGDDQAWSLEELERQASRARVFQRRPQEPGLSAVDAEGDAPPARDRNPLVHLGQALDEPVWLVAEDLRGGGQDLPRPDPEGLAGAVLARRGPFAAMERRRPLLRALGTTDALEKPVVRSAIRALLTDEREPQGELYYAGSSAPPDLQRATRGLLKLLDRDYALYPSILGQGLTGEALQLVNADHELRSDVLHDLIAEAQRTKQLDRIDSTTTEAVLRATAPPAGDHAAEHRWDALPLHRRVGGARGPITAQAVRRVPGVDVPQVVLEGIVAIDPDGGLEGLYGRVPELGRAETLARLLCVEACSDHAGEVVRLLEGAGDDVAALLSERVRPAGGEPKPLKVLVEDTPWIPLATTAEGARKGRLKDLLVVPKELEPELDRSLPMSRLRPAWRPAELDGWLRARLDPLLPHLTSRAKGDAAHLVDAVRDTRSRWPDLSISGCSPGASESQPKELLLAGLELGLADVDAGWRLLRAANATARTGDLTNATEELALALAGPAHRSRLLAQLQRLGEATPLWGSPGQRLHLGILQELPRLSADELGGLALPAADQTWQPATCLSPSTVGLQPRYLVHPEVRGLLGINASTVFEDREGAGADPGAGAAALERYFDRWRRRVPDRVIGAFLALLGSTPELAETARAWLQRDPQTRTWDVLRVREQLGMKDRWPSLPPPRLGPEAQADGEVMALNLCGGRFAAQAAGTNGDLGLFAREPALIKLRGQEGRELSFRRVDPEHKSTRDLEQFIFDALRWWCREVLTAPPGGLDRLWELIQDSQVAVGPAHSAILAGLPTTLRQLRAHELPELGEALTRAEAALYRRDSTLGGSMSTNGVAPAYLLQEAYDALKALEDRLTTSDRFTGQVRSRVCEAMRSFGYSEESVLFELCQNADDALAQREAVRGPVPEAARVVTIRLHTVGGARTLDLLHHGRPINETWGADGLKQRWDHDLYAMLVMNMSAKPGEGAGGAPGATTGRFGLGFKAVHLISAHPEVVSGQLCFGIAAALIPESLEWIYEAEFDAVPDCELTRIRLSLDRGEADAIEAKVFRRFSAAMPLLAAFARAVRELRVEGGPRPGTTRFRGARLAPGWRLGADRIGPGEQADLRLLRFALRDLDGPGGSSAALAVALRGGEVVAMPADTPTLWSVAPTSDPWGLGYAINGPLKLDPGRAHVALDAPATVAALDQLGQALGDGLVALDDALRADDPAARTALDLADGAAVDRLLASLWGVLSTQLLGSDPTRQPVLERLHAGPDRGLGRWMYARPAAPSGLPSPFRPRLPAGGGPVREVTGALADGPLLAALGAVPDIGARLSEAPAATPAAAELARRLRAGAVRGEPLHLFEVLGWLAPGGRLSAAAWQALVPVVADAAWSSSGAEAEAAGWLGAVRVLAADGEARPAGDLLAPVGQGDEEDLIAALAPDARRLHPDHLRAPGGAAAHRRLRGRHQVGPEGLDAWVREAGVDTQPAAVTYLARGEHRQHVLSKLRATGRGWWSDRPTVDRAIGGAGLSALERDQLVAALFPTAAPAPAPPTRVQPDRARTLLEELHDAWAGPAGAEQLRSWEAARYPPPWHGDHLRHALQGHVHEDEAPRTAWLILMSLATLQRMGRATPAQHLGFLTTLLAQPRTRWDLLFAPYDPGQSPQGWFAFLDAWSDGRDTDALPYDHWLSRLPELFPVWRHLPDYVHILRNINQNPGRPLHLLLAPRGDPEWQHGGPNAPALPRIAPRWLVAELVRLGVVARHPNVDAFAWHPGERLHRVLCALGMPATGGDPAWKQASYSRQVHAWLRDRLPGRDPTFHGAFDKPLVSDAFVAELGRTLGLQVAPEDEAPDAADVEPTDNALEEAAPDDSAGGWP